jgi:hypothetical protein
MIMNNDLNDLKERGNGVFEWLYQYLPPGGTEKAHDDFMPIGL